MDESLIHKLNYKPDEQIDIKVVEQIEKKIIPLEVFDSPLPDNLKEMEMQFKPKEADKYAGIVNAQNKKNQLEFKKIFKKL